jgi:hypothetical protein
VYLDNRLKRFFEKLLDMYLQEAYKNVRFTCVRFFPNTCPKLGELRAPLNQQVTQVRLSDNCPPHLTIQCDVTRVNPEQRFRHDCG